MAMDTPPTQIKTQPRAKDLDGEDYELWLLRAPSGFDATLLEGITLQHDMKRPETPNALLYRVENPDDKRLGYEVRSAFRTESDGFRVLLSSKSKQGLMARAFDRQYVISQRFKEDEGQAHAIAEPSVPVIIPYAPVKQMEDMQVRSRPIGAGFDLPPELMRITDPFVSVEDESRVKQKKRKRASTNSTNRTGIRAKNIQAEGGRREKRNNVRKSL